MKILSAAQIREADSFTIANEPVSSLMLMERASTACFNWIAGHFNKNTSFLCVCGIGNNGGDGLVISRLLIKNGYSVRVVIVEFSNIKSDDFLCNEKLLKQNSCSNIKYVRDIEQFPDIPANTVIIDALFGTGLNKPVDGFVAEVIHKINASPELKLSIDIPSGLFCDEPSVACKAIVNADITLTFQVPKLAFLLPENYKFVGEWYVLNIGLDNDFIENASSKNFFIDRNFAKKIIQPRTKYSHKGNFGHALLISGSYGKIGAAVMAAKSCLRSGAGLLTVHIPECGYQIIQSTVPEAMVSVDENQYTISSFPSSDRYNAIAIGPGIGNTDETQKAFKVLIQNTAIPLIIDADAINILSENKTWLAFLPKYSILTPHPKEFERLFGKPDNDYHRLELQIEFSMKYSIYIIYKGAYTTISTPQGELLFNSTGNPGMATGGSGDVLTGIILGLMASGYHALHASILGVYLHGLAGDLARDSKGEEALIASDITKCLGKAFKQLKT